MPTELLDGEQVLRLLWARFNPDQGRQRPPAPTSTVEVLGELDAPDDRDVAREAAVRLKEKIAQSSLDFRALTPSRDGRSRRRADDLRATHPPGGPRMGWLHGAMLTRQPYTLSVYVHGARAAVASAGS